MIEVKGLTKSFKDVHALKGISFKVPKGEVLGLLGENGAGKTTTLRILATMLKPTKGTAILSGHDILKNQQAVRREIGILFGGESGLYDRLTARENIAYYAELNDISKEEIKERIDYLTKILDMEEYIDRRVGKFSKGMKQKVAIARSIVHNPPIMLFDEPTSGLDVTAARTIHSFIEECRKEGKTVIFSSHSMVEVEKLCERVAIIHKGNIIEEGSIEELKIKYNKNLEDLFVELVGGTNE
ncbi:ATP-binding cassette domain-containing protein [Alkaliphilus sp. MSJ-5]|uniref:ATP-binding cassette domain-containing protein n=1 Tax=Alkaliphilus flagellatus TaxID=2841507 RepID=A0ABS6G6P7_9FIRM|nr:ATP-binding cassette domain-containing protein [Alkaliphilus flagellatus]MBU5678160.1 ATP-binding cassette domain-containing protein [Alkaliphilus flagellatus]